MRASGILPAEAAAQIEEMATQRTTSKHRIIKKMGTTGSKKLSTAGKSESFKHAARTFSDGDGSSFKPYRKTTGSGPEGTES